MKPRLQFIPNTARKPQGLNHPGIEQFRDHPYVSCARETGQNSNDAPEAGKRPVRLKFNLLDVSRADVPFADELTAVAAACLEQSTERCKKNGKEAGGDKTVAFFKKAVASLSNDTIKVFEIADANTTGLTGPFDDPESVFNSLVKADGITNKQRPDSGGSFGIGKNAVFAVSDIQTVVYSTIAGSSAGGGADKFACQARTQLISHEFAGQPRSAEGYWGIDDFNAITDSSNLPKWMVRTERGTSIFAICFRLHESWSERMTLSIITNFAIAIMRGDMEFEVADGKFKINQSTLPSLLDDPELAKVAESAYLAEALVRVRHLYACLTSGVATKHDIEVPDGLRARLHILVAEGMPRAISIIRNGMYITDNLQHFGFPLRQFPGTKEFIAVLEPVPGEKGEALGALLKRMENPEHNNFSPERLGDDDEQRRVQKSFAKLHKVIREHIRAAAQVAQSDQSNLDELARLFSTESNSNSGKQSPEKDPERYVYGKSTTPKKKPKAPSDKPGTRGGATPDIKSGGDGGGGTGDGSGTGAGTGGKGTRSTTAPFPITQARSRREPAGASYAHRVYFTPGESGQASITLHASGLTKPVRLSIVAADSGKLHNGAIELDLLAGVRQSIAVNFADAYDGPIDITSLALVTETKQ